MAPFHKAINIELRSEGPDGITYTGEVDPEWTVGAVPNGGYLLALLLEACIRHQSTTPHPDPIHVTAHYLKSSIPGAFEIRVRALRTGRGFTNLCAEFYQQGTMNVSTQQIFGTNSAAPQDSKQRQGLSLAPPSAYARRIPLYSHPSTALVRPGRGAIAQFTKYFDLAPDPSILEKNASDHPNRTNSSTVGGEGLEWGAWFSFQDGDEITKTSIPLLVDIFAGIPFLMPPSERPGFTGVHWYPTMVLAIEFKAPLPSFSSVHANRSVGIYSWGRFVQDSRHDNNVEIWTAPCNIGEGKELPGWREQQVCIATATQMAYIVPMEANLERGRKQQGSKL